MQYTFKAVIKSLSKNCPTCDNRTTGHILFLNCGMQFQSKTVEECKPKLKNGKTV